MTRVGWDSGGMPDPFQVAQITGVAKARRPRPSRSEEALAAQLRMSRMWRDNPDAARAEAKARIRGNLGTGPDTGMRRGPRIILEPDLAPKSTPIGRKPLSLAGLGAGGKKVLRVARIAKSGQPVEVSKSGFAPLGVKPVLGTKEHADQAATLKVRRAKRKTRGVLSAMSQGAVAGRVHGITAPEVQNRYSAAFL